MQKVQYKNYLLGVLLATLALNLVDRQALALVLQNVKADLRVTDTQLGLLTGLAFAAFYSIMGIPIARWADRGNRVVIISLTTAIWSVGVMLCGVAANFLQLLLIRVSVAAGEAGCVPPAHSLIADHFSRAERPRAVARYMLGGPLSVAMGYLLAGWLNEFYGWRTTFVVLGLPGVVLAALSWLSLKEPRRAMKSGSVASDMQSASGSQKTPTVGETLRTLLANRTYCHLTVSLSVASFFASGIAQWLPAFFVRSFGLGTGELGTWLAAIGVVAGFIGTYLGGELATRRAGGNEPLQLKGMAVAYCAGTVLLALMLLSPNRYFAFGAMSVFVVMTSAAGGPLFATIQTLIPERMRAMSIAIVYFLSNLIGLGLGPLIAGALSDALRPSLGEESLRFALLALCPGYLWAAWHLWRATGSVMQDLMLLRTVSHAAATPAQSVAKSIISHRV